MRAFPIARAFRRGICLVSALVLFVGLPSYADEFAAATGQIAAEQVEQVEQEHLSTGQGVREDTPDKAIPRNGPDDATAALASLLDALTTLQGEFNQRQYDENGVLLVASSGVFRLLRPGYFYWEIQAPDSQLVVADPQYVWHHDRDLETATRRPAHGQDDLAPLEILNADSAFLHSNFSVAEASAGSYTLTPTNPALAFNQVLLVFDGNVVQSMQIEDKLGQRVVVQFSKVVQNPALVVEDFAFTPPASADIFYYDQ